MTRKILPVVGACAGLTIDPVASLAPDVRQDPAAIAACAKLVNKKFVVLVSSRSGFYEPNAPYNQCTVLFLFQGEPKAYPDRCIEPSMSLPISPMTDATHPSSREPLKASKPLPWNDCYVSCHGWAEVRSPTTFTEAPVEYVLDREEIRRHDRYLEADVAQKARLMSARATEQAKASPGTPTSIPVYQPGNLTGQAVAVSASKHADGPLVDPDLAQHREDDGTSVEAANNVPSSRPPSQGVITVNFDHDLSTVEELIDPAEYFKEVEAIASIEAEAWPRVARAKAKAIEDAVAAAAEINARAYDNRTGELNPDCALLV
ncbi:hypothetical protein C8R46DRAFT_1198194 [Mycena filopes]|nr:hypothetical protein C8R46DRAFT_1202510 [Mycena filopes]KAJ7151261.1 hypothetical protein C8R46DRAFT_1198194 [Mycena filopes]